MNYQSTCHNSIFYVVTEDWGGEEESKKAFSDEDSPCLFCAPYRICIDKECNLLECFSQVFWELQHNICPLRKMWEKGIHNT